MNINVSVKSIQEFEHICKPQQKQRVCILLAASDCIRMGNGRVESRNKKQN